MAILGLFATVLITETRHAAKLKITNLRIKIESSLESDEYLQTRKSVSILPYNSFFTVGDEGAVRSTCRLGDEDEDEEEENEERWKFGWQQ